MSFFFFFVPTAPGRLNATLVLRFVYQQAEHSEEKVRLKCNSIRQAVNSFSAALKLGSTQGFMLFAFTFGFGGLWNDFANTSCVCVQPTQNELNPVRLHCGGANMSRMLDKVEILLLLFFNFAPIWEDDKYKGLVWYLINLGWFIMRNLPRMLLKWMSAVDFCAFSTFNTTT